MGWKEFACEFDALPYNADDSILDALVRRHFSFEPECAPDIVRAYLRSMRDQPGATVWHDIRKLEVELQRFTPEERMPPMKRVWAQSSSLVPAGY
jgi:hypothetical protein